MSDDQEIDDILENIKSKPKKIKSGRKGKRIERLLCKLLNDRFSDLLEAHKDWGNFSRTIGSGNRWGQNVQLSQEAQNTFGGDVVCPPTFKFVVESKGGYDDIDLVSVFDEGHYEIDNWISQAEDEAERTKRLPVIVWKKNRKPQIAIVRNEDLPDTMDRVYELRYREWSMVAFDDWIKLPDDYFFSLTK